MPTTFRTTLVIAGHPIRDIAVTWGLQPVSCVRETAPTYGADIEVAAVVELLDLIASGVITAEEVADSLTDLAAAAKQEEGHEREYERMELGKDAPSGQPEVQPRADSRWVYVVSGEDTPKVVKIGVTGNIEKRIKSLQTSSASQVTLRWSARGGLPLESYLHEKFSRRRLSGEWFDFRRTPDPVKVISEAAQVFLAGEEVE